MGEKNVWPTIIKFSSLIVLVLNIYFIHEVIHLRFCKPRRGVATYKLYAWSTICSNILKNLESLRSSAQA